MKYLVTLVLSLVSPLALAASRVPDFNIREIIWNIVVLAGIAVCFGLLDYGVSKAPFITEPIKLFIHWILIVIACLLLIFMILGMLGL